MVDEGNGVVAFKYIDDTTLVEKVSLEGAVRHYTTNKTVETIAGMGIGAALDDLKEIGMKINTKKTQLLIISPTNGCHTTGVIDTGGDTIKAREMMRLVGFNFGNSPDCAVHMEEIRNRFRMKVWMLFHLRKAGMRQMTLFRVYCCFVRSIIEYCSVVYHSLLTKG